MIGHPDRPRLPVAQGVRSRERLMWACSLALVAILGGMGALYEHQQALGRNIQEVREDVGRIDERTIQLDKRLGVIEEMLRVLGRGAGRLRPGDHGGDGFVGALWQRFGSGSDACGHEPAVVSPPESGITHETQPAALRSSHSGFGRRPSVLKDLRPALPPSRVETSRLPIDSPPRMRRGYSQDSLRILAYDPE